MTPQEATRLLFQAAEAGKVSQATDFARLLIEKGAQVNAKDEWQQTPLHWASYNGNTDTARLLIEKGAQVNARDEWQRTPLHFAAYSGHTDLARLLIEKGAQVNSKGYWKQTPLQLAAENGHTDLVTLLQDAAKDQTSHAGRVAKRRGSDEPQIGG